MVGPDLALPVGRARVQAVSPLYGPVRLACVGDGEGQVGGASWGDGEGKMLRYTPAHLGVGRLGATLADIHYFKTNPRKRCTCAWRGSCGGRKMRLSKFARGSTPVSCNCRT